MGHGDMFCVAFGSQKYVVLSPWVPIMVAFAGRIDTVSPDTRIGIAAHGVL